MITWLISDLHLQPEREDLAQAFTAFVKHTVQDGDKLYILGDFFNAWIGDDEDNPFYLDIIDTLSTLQTRNIQTWFMHGNRDFLVQTAFAERAGVTLLDEPAKIELAGKNVLLMHGDSLCTGDKEYIAFRQQVRNPDWQAGVLSLPLAQRRIMAADLREKSMSMNSNKAEDIMDVTPSEVDRVIMDYNVEILIHGHTHRPARHALANNKERIVLGDWDKQGWYIRASQENIELEAFDIVDGVGT